MRSIKVAALSFLGMGIREMMLPMSSSLRDSKSKEEEVQEAAGERTRQRLCTMEQIVRGKWAMGTEKHKPPYTPMPGEVQQRTCRGFDPSARWQDWEWTPDDAHECDFLNSDFDSDLFCSLVRNKTILIQGDSVSFDHFLSLTHLMGVPVALPRARPKDPVRVSKICNNTSTLIGKRDYLLEQVGHVLNEFHPDVVILNRGVWYEPDHELIGHLNANVTPHIEKWQDQCELDKKDCHFVWRSTVPGHPNCMKFTQPSDNVEEMEAMIAQTPKYNWDKFKSQNELVLDFLLETFTDFDLLDGYPINILRPDLHNPGNDDCLHNCLPRDNIYSFITLHLLRLWSERSGLGALQAGGEGQLHKNANA